MDRLVTWSVRMLREKCGRPPATQADRSLTGETSPGWGRASGVSCTAGLDGPGDDRGISPYPLCAHLHGGWRARGGGHPPARQAATAPGGGQDARCGRHARADLRGARSRCRLRAPRGHGGRLTNCGAAATRGRAAQAGRRECPWAAARRPRQQHRSASVRGVVRCSRRCGRERYEPAGLGAWVKVCIWVVVKTILRYQRPAWSEL